MLMNTLVNRIQVDIYFMITLWLYIALHVNFDWFGHVSIAGKDKIDILQFNITYNVSINPS